MERKLSGDEVRESRMPTLQDQHSVWFPLGNGGWRLVQVYEDGRVFVDGVLSAPVRSTPESDSQ